MARYPIDPMTLLQDDQELGSLLLQKPDSFNEVLSIVCSENTATNV
jgi:hypothetical protein